MIDIGVPVHPVTLPLKVSKLTRTVTGYRGPGHSQPRLEPSAKVAALALIPEAWGGRKVPWRICTSGLSISWWFLWPRTSRSSALLVAQHRLEGQKRLADVGAAIGRLPASPGLSHRKNAQQPQLISQGPLREPRGSSSRNRCSSHDVCIHRQNTAAKRETGLWCNQLEHTASMSYVLVMRNC